MKVPPTVKWLLSIPLVIANSGLLLLAIWLLTTMLVLAYLSAWWLAMLVTIATGTFVLALLVVSAGQIRHFRDFRDPQRVLVCSFQALWLNLAGVVLGGLLLFLFLLLPAVTATN